MNELLDEEQDIIRTALIYYRRDLQESLRSLDSDGITFSKVISLKAKEILLEKLKIVNRLINDLTYCD